MTSRASSVKPRIPERFPASPPTSTLLWAGVQVHTEDESKSQNENSGQPGVAAARWAIAQAHERVGAWLLLAGTSAGAVLGVKGLGEMGNCGSGAAVANAVFNAIGVRDFPITLDKVLPGLPLVEV